MTKRAFPLAAQLAELPSDVREQAVLHAGRAVPHMYMPMSTELGSQQKSFLLWKIVRDWAAVYPRAAVYAVSLKLNRV